MKFEYPQFLFAFLLLAIPIIIHLFNFRRYKTLNFSSLFFIKQINEETKSTQKLKHLLVLLARLLAFSSLILAFAQPYLPVKKNAVGSYPFLGIYIDNSFSMSMKGAEGELISMAKEKARSIIKKSSADTRFMLVTNDFEGFEQRLTTKIEALERIDKIEISPLVRKIDEVINWMKEGLSEEVITEKKLSSKQLILLSDFQKSSSNFDKLSMDSTIFYYPIQLIAQNTANLSIDSIWFSDPNFKVGINNELNVKITNHSENEIVNSELRLDVNGSKRDVFVDLKAKSSDVVKINYTDNKPGLKKGTLQISDRQMHFDDDYFFSYEVKEKSSALIIDGENSVENIKIVYGLDNYYQVNSINQNSFTGENLSQKDLVILNGWNEISSASSESLYNFCKEGGTLALFPGEKLDVRSMNYFLSKLNAPRFGNLVNSGTKIQKIIYEDAFFLGMFEKKPDKINLPSQTKSYSISKNNALNLIVMQNGSPLFLKLSNSYSLYIFTSSLTNNFGNFTTNALFSSLLLRIGESSQRRYPISLTIGSEAKFPIYNVPQVEEALKLKSENLEFIPQLEVNNDLSSISILKNTINSSLKSGFFEIIKGKTIGYIALNYNREESNIQILNELEIKNNFTAKGIEHVSFSSLSSESDGALIKLDKPKEYWRIFIILALVFLFAEMSLLKWFK
jgi:hypothetical protein